jgi:hypothetical protein
MTLAIPLIIVIGILAWLLRPGKSPTKARIVAILVTAIPQFVVAIAAIVFQLVHNAAGKTWVSDISNTFFLVGLGLTGVAILASIGLALAHRGDVAKGAGFGVCTAVIISIIVFGLLEWLGGV